LHDAQTRETAEHAAAQTARSHAEQDRALLAMYTRARYTEGSSFLTYILGSNDIATAMARAASMSKVVDSGQELLTRLNADIASADKAEAAARADESAAQADAARLHDQEQQLRKQTANESSLIGQLDAQSRAALDEIQAA